MKALEFAKMLHTLGQSHGQPYLTRVADKELIVFPKVHSPRYFRDSAFLIKELRIVPGERFLEIGAGTGVISVHAALAGARVTATDISPDAVRNTLANAERFGLTEMRVLEGDLYAPLAPDERFDTIFWNFPFGFEEPQDVSGTQPEIIDPGYRALERFVVGASSHLEPGGRVLLGFSPTIGNQALFDRILAAQQFAFQVIAEESTAEESKGGLVFQLIEARLQRS